MTSFDFLKNFNNELYEIAVKLEEDVLESPRAVTADATLFLENLVKDIYRLSQKKLERNLISFYKKIDNLYRLGVISYIYKKKLQDAYNLRNKIHNASLDSNEEKDLAFDLHKRLYYISKKYFRDFCENERYIEINDYRKPAKNEIHFDNCIICGNSNKTSSSNLCRVCNQKIENANFMLSLKNTFNDMPFTRQDLIELGINESRAILFLMDLSKHGAVKNTGNYYTLKPKNFEGFISEINEYAEIGLLITRFYKDEISASQIKETLPYKKGSENQIPYREFYRLVNQKIERTFEDNLIKTRDIKRSMKLSSMSRSNIEHWYYHEKDAFNDGILNDAFILYNEILIREFFEMKKKIHEPDTHILRQLNIPKDIYYFWQDHFMAGRFFNQSRSIKKNKIIEEIKKNKTLKDALIAAKVSKKDFDKMYLISKENNGEFYRNFHIEYTCKRQKSVIKHLKRHNLNKAIKLSKITKAEFLKWYYEGEKNVSDFYVKTTRILMDKYLYHRKNDLNKKDILKKINVPRDMFKSWMEHDEFNLFADFEDENEKITSSLLKRGMVINGIKEGKSKEEAIFYANMTPREFMEIYNNSKREKTEFYSRFDAEYEKNRKRLFARLIKDDDFYCTLQKCEISQKDFNRWYFRDQDRFLSSNKASAFYLTTTCELMDKYLKARINGKNKPDAAKSVGLTNTTINKWLNHSEFEIFYDFSKKNTQATIDLIVRGFAQGKSKMEVSEISDISIRTIEEFIELGRQGSRDHKEIFDLYEGNVIPLHLETFLGDIRSKTFYRALKHAKLSEEELNKYYDLGKSGDSPFSNFYRDYLQIKIDLYVASVLSKKSSKIALKNSNLTMEEFSKNEDSINSLIMKGRIEILIDGIEKHKSTGAKLSKALGISIDEIYEWYFMGKDGDERYEEFAAIFEAGVILPRVVAIKKAQRMGAPRKWLNKRLKKDIGNADYKIWQRHDLLNREITVIDSKGNRISSENMLDMINYESFTKISPIKGDSKSKPMKISNGKSNAIMKISVMDESELKKKAFGK